MNDHKPTDQNNFEWAYRAELCGSCFDLSRQWTIRSGVSWHSRIGKVAVKEHVWGKPLVVFP